ncbi:hypothetical protein NOS3756_08810 [Nostoc sp. NIES-3756]|uniref:hypothetical protein n=1 Tax=Nostoc sp. NIES-3756 TaxID=1751286 RepID=UPI0007209EBD|nr:hypothetical protein [Nostoc sp. NIES-3756]BAT51950.1 hypothetical protein NOS3756_08810 [Nostoc sp. NIES-3756]
MNYFNYSKIKPDYLILLIFFLTALVIDKIWLSLDESIPAYDQSAHLTTALHHYRIFQHFNIFSSDWWLSLWQLTPSYRAPFVYICTIPFLLFGRSYDQAVLVNSLYTLIIIFSVYHLGIYLFNNRKIAITASAFCVLFPILGIMRIDYLLDYGLTAIVIGSFTILTIWKDKYNGLFSWILTLTLGIGIGLIMLSKPTGFIFILIPGILTLISFIRKRKYLKLIQAGLSLIISWLICGFWYGLNWLTIITSALNANQVGKREGDPPATTIAGWLAYPQMIPETVGFPILFVSLGILLAYIIKNKFDFNLIKNKWSQYGLSWLIIFLVSSYIICSLGTNKDSRFILPCFPIIALILSYCFNLIDNKLFNKVRIATLGLSFIVLLNSIFPLPIIQAWGGIKHLPNNDGKKYQIPQLIETINQTNIYLRSTLGVIPVSTPQVNQFTLDYFGTLADFRVYARKLTTKLSQVEQDLENFSWYVTRDNEPDERSERGETKRKLKSLVESSPDLKLQGEWILPPGDKLRLYHRINPAVVVKKLDNSPSPVTLKQVITANQLVVAHNNPITYQVTGTWDDLQNGLLLLRWQNGQLSFDHDHAIALGNLYCGLKCHPQGTFQVTENIATFLPKNLPLGTYQLSALYLDRRNGNVKPLNVQNITVDLTDKGTITKSPALDLVSQMSQLALELRQGKLDNIFEQISNFNQYDPTQDYLKQIEFAANYHLQTEPANLNWRYTLVLSQLLQRQVPELIENLTQLTKYDSQNPYVWLYLAFVYLYDFQPRQAEPKLAIAEKLQPNIPELKTLKTVNNIMKFLPLIHF